MKSLTGLFRITSLTVLLIFAISCSNDDISNFQQNDPEPEFKLFNILDNYPALRSAFNSVDQRRFNSLLAMAVNANLQETNDILPLVDDLMNNPGHPVTDLISYSRNIVDRIIEQDKLYFTSVKKYEDSSNNYSNDFFRFYDLISDSNLELSDNLVAIMKKVIGYIKARYKGDQLEDMIADVTNYLREDAGESIDTIIKHTFDGMGKLFLQANENMWLDSIDRLITDRSKIMGIGEKDTGLGNATRGMESLLTGLYNVLKNNSVRDDIYNLLRQVGNFLGSTVEDKGLNVILQHLLCNMEDYFTQGGDIYSSSNNDYNQDGDVYINAELGNTVKEFFPALSSLFIRGDRINSIITDDGQWVYPLELLARNLKRADIDVESLNIEDTLYKMIRVDGKGRDRLTDSMAANVSYLDQLIFILTTASNFGYLDGGDTGEGNHGHGHGESTGGILTLNDCLFNLTSGYILDVLGAYNLCLDHFAPGGPHGDYVYRSTDAFNENETSDKKFFMDSNFPALQLMSGETVGDAGSPDGGSGTSDWNSFKAYCKDGIEESNTARWIMGWIARACWEGEGPYYFKGEEENCKYKDEWNTDYYLIQLPEGLSGTTRHYAPNVVDLSDDKKLVDTDEAGCITVHEMIKSEDNRECDTWVEAIYKNFQWLLFEKKFVFVIPLRIDMDVVGRAAVYLKVEANGIIGVTKAKKNDNNGQWLVNGGYGNSTELGDARMSILLGGAEGVANMDLIMNEVIGDGNVMPDVFAANLSPVEYLGFFTQEVVASNNADPDNVLVWEKRNGILPILVALVGGLHEYTSRNERYPLKTLTDGLLLLLAKPMVYYQKDSGNNPYNCWKPRLEDGHNYLKPAVHLDPEADIETYYMPKDNPTLLTILSESDYKKCDGIIPLLSKTRLITSLLAVIMKLGDPEFDDPEGSIYDDNFDNNFANWGARRKVFYGLEQVFSTIKTTKGEALAKGYMNIGYPDWMFYVDDNELRQEDLRLATFIEELVGSDSSGKGIAVFPDNRPNPEDWDTFNKIMEAPVEMLSDNGISTGSYNITEEIIGLIDKIFRGVDITHEEIRGLCHTMGSVFTIYNNSKGDWEYPGELMDILTKELPELLEVFQGHYSNLFTLCNAMMNDDGFLEYFLKALHSPYPSSQVFSELSAFIGTDLVARYDSPLWRDLAELLKDFAILSGKQQNERSNNYDILNISNPFKALGELLSN
ncbi:MAG: hypothetical protein SVZ03_00810 [Spirochaetota bacterium]|nr:hypothetical protein [Spirochaetota bacterium]